LSGGDHSSAEYEVVVNTRFIVGRGLRSAPLVLQLPGWRLGLRLRHLRCPGDSGPSAFQRPGARGLGFTVVNPIGSLKIKVEASTLPVVVFTPLL